jgi:hypothetical protein
MERIITPIVVNMMHIHMFSCFFAYRTRFMEMLQSIFAIPAFSMCEITIFHTSRLRFITALNRTKYLFRVICSRFCKRKILSTQFTLTGNRRLPSNGFEPTFFRATNCFCFGESKGWDRKGSSADRTNNISLFFLRVNATFERAKKLFAYLKFVGLNLKQYVAERAVNFHVRKYNTQKVF